MITVHHLSSLRGQKPLLSADSNQQTTCSPQQSASNRNQLANRSKSLSMMAFCSTLQNKVDTSELSLSTGSKSVLGMEDNIKIKEDQCSLAEKNKQTFNGLENKEGFAFREISRLHKKGQEQILGNEQYSEKLGHKLPLANTQISTITNNVSSQLTTFFDFIGEIEGLFHSQKLEILQSSKAQSLVTRNNIEQIKKYVQKTITDNITMENKLFDLQNKSKESERIIQQQKEKIRNLKKLYREVVLERQLQIFENYTIEKKKQQQCTNSKQEITLLKAMMHKIRPAKSKLNFKNTSTANKTETRSEVEELESNYYDDQLLEFDHSQTTLKNKEKHHRFQLEQQIINNQRKGSTSEISNDFFFELDKSDSGLRLTIDKLKQRIEQLEFQLKIKDETLSVINSFIEQNAQEVNIKDRLKIMEAIKKHQVKQKLSNSLKLAEENAYLKKCMQKLSKSEVFWSKFDTPSPEEDTRKENRQKCLLF